MGGVSSRGFGEGGRAGDEDESRRELTDGMLLLLGEVVGDTDGSADLTLISEARFVERSVV